MTALTLNGLSETHVVGQHAPSDLFVQMYIRPHKLNAFDLMGEQLAVNILIDLEAIFELLRFELEFFPILPVAPKLPFAYLESFLWNRRCLPVLGL